MCVPDDVNATPDPQSYMVYEGKQSFADDYGCGVAVPVTGTVGFATVMLSSAGIAVAVLIAIIEVVAAAGAGAEGAVMGAVAAAIGAGTIAFLGLGCLIVPCGQMVSPNNVFLFAHIAAALKFSVSWVHALVRGSA